MSEQAPQHEQFPLTEADLLAPDGVTPRIHNGEKAQTMALATDLEESTAAGLRVVAKDALSAGMDEGDFQQTVVDTEVPSHYKEVLDSHMSDPTTDLSPDGIVSDINQEQKTADRRYDFVSESYDKINATKR